jgi:hypothetical protein
MIESILCPGLLMIGLLCVSMIDHIHEGPTYGMVLRKTKETYAQAAISQHLIMSKLRRCG